MTNNELLVEISGMLQTNLKPIQLQISSLEKRIDNVEIRLGERIDSLEHCVRDDILPRVIKLEDTMDKRVIPGLTKLEETMDKRVIPGLTKLEETMDKRVIPGLTKLELTMENRVLPGLDDISKCYADTYKRYSKGVNQIESMQQDIDILKRVSIEHSKKLAGMS